MKKMLKWWFGVLSLVLTVAWVAHAQQSSHVSLKGFQPGSDFVPNEILVLVNPGGKTLDRPNGTSVQEWIKEIKQWIISSGLKIEVDDAYTYDLADLATKFGRENLPSLKNPRVCGGTLLTLRTQGKPDDTAALDAAVQAVEDEITRLTNLGGYNSSRDIMEAIPNPGFTKPDSAMPPTEEADPIDLTVLSGTAVGVKVAILDSGFATKPVNPNTSNLSLTRISSTRNPVGIDTTATPPNFSTWNEDNFESLDHDEVNLHGHGTPIARIISGIAKRSVIIPVKVCDQTGLCTGRNVTIGLCYAAYRHAQVVNMSFGGFYDSQLVYEAIQDMLAQGALVVAGAGNSRNLLWNRSPLERSRETPEMSRSGDFTGAERPAYNSSRGWNQSVYPAAWSTGSTAAAQGNADGIISVGSINSKKYVSKFSSMNTSVDVVTYGEKIRISFGFPVVGSFSYLSELRSGTSFAAPIIAGIAAVLRYRNPTWTAPEVESAIVRAGDTNNYDCYLDDPNGSIDPAARNNCVSMSATTPESRRVSVSQHNIDKLRSLLGI